MEHAIAQRHANWMRKYSTASTNTTAGVLLNGGSKNRLFFAPCRQQVLREPSAVSFRTVAKESIMPQKKLWMGFPFLHQYVQTVLP